MTDQAENGGHRGELRSAVLRQNDVSRLTEELERARLELDRRKAEADSLRAEIGILRAVSGRFRSSAIRHAQAIAGPGRSHGRMVDRVWALLSSAVLRRRRAKAELDAIRSAGLFDAAWYLKRYPDVEEAGIDPLLHYHRHGADEERDPHPLFDSTWYRSNYPEVNTSWMTPLGHFVMVGAAKHYDPNPLFHAAWYVVQNPDVVAKGLNPLRHYMQYGAEPGRNPNPMFDSAWYLNENKDVREAGENALSHYIHHGIAEMRDPHPMFDSAWYLKHYEHVSAAGIDALEHYLTIGLFEGCRPGPDTDVGGERRRVRAVARRALSGDQSAPARPAAHEAGANGVRSPTDIMAWQMRLGGAHHQRPAFTGQIGVFVHLFYEELAAEIAECLLAIPFEYKVYISTNNQTKKAAIESAFRRFGIEPMIKVVHNRGWDVAPFVASFADEIRSHDICLKLHGKISSHGQKGSQWRRYLLSGLVGDRQNVTDIVGNFVAHPDLGVLMMPHWPAVARRAHIIGANYRHMRALLRRAGLSISADQKIEFPSGSMFWFRSRALAPLLDLGLAWADFSDCRPRNVDATIAHAVERSILIFAALGGYKWAHHPRGGRWRRWLRAGRVAAAREAGDPART